MEKFSQLYTNGETASIDLPWGVTGLTIICYGGGGCGGIRYVGDGAGGGGGGGGGCGYSYFTTYPDGAGPGTTLTISAASGGKGNTSGTANDGGESYVYSGSSFSPVYLVRAYGGKGVGISGTGGLGGKGAGNTGSYTGGSGANGAARYGGGGGGGAGPQSGGSNGSGSSGGSGGKGNDGDGDGTYPGKGGAGRLSSGGAGNGSSGYAYGGGGGGEYPPDVTPSYAGGSGAYGAVSIEYYWPGNNVVLNIINKFSKGTAVISSQKILNAGAADQTVWIDSNSDGLADYWVGDVSCTYAITSNVGFPNTVQQTIGIGTNDQCVILSNTFDTSSTKTYTLNFWYQCTSDLTVTLGSSGGSNVFAGSRDAVNDSFVYTPSASESGIRLRFTTPADTLIIDKVSLLES